MNQDKTPEAVSVEMPVSIPTSPASAPAVPQAATGDRTKRFPRPPSRRPGLAPRRRVCRFCSEKIRDVDFKQVQILRNYLMESGKILPARVTGLCAKHQRQLSTAIKRARNLSLLPYVIR